MSGSSEPGRVVLDVEGLALTAADRVRLQHSQTGGVILFSRNFASIAQLTELTSAIHALRPGLIIAVDHEGGRVQRFRDGFTALPPMRALGQLWDRNEDAALRAARDCGYVLAAELVACGVNLSFTPVLDLDFGPSGVIGDRAFHRQGAVVAALAAALQRGMGEAGLATCGKHFPGHGYVRADSHHEVPVDDRSFEAIAAEDLLPYRQLIPAGLGAVMPAHVIYPRVDPAPAGFSRHWLTTVLRGQYRFAGVIFSDDLSMEGASVAGGYDARAHAALEAGCDMVLVCNDHVNAQVVLEALEKSGAGPVPAKRLLGLRRAPSAGSRAELAMLPRYRAAAEALAAALA
ncbi:MAG: beta-N-acetylhexosaminidase [Burkholderiales bacterium]|nr:beta-N-acetylhexosaminidase [Burkholderiales bacterium]